MKLFHEQVIGGVVIAGLVAIGLLMAEEPGWPRLFEGPFFATSNNGGLSSITVNHFDWSADGQVLSQSRGAATAMQTLTLHDVNGTGHTLDWAHSENVSINHASLAPDGESVVVATDGGQLWWVDLETWAFTELKNTSKKSAFVATSIGHDGQFMAGGTCDGQVFIFDPRHGAVRQLSTEKDAVSRLRFSSDSTRLLCTRTNGAIAVWDTSTGEQLLDVSGQDNLPTAAAFLPDCNRVMASLGESIHIWDLVSGAALWRGTHGSAGRFGTAAFDVASNGGQAAWAAIANHRVVVWDLENRRIKREIINPSVVLDLRFSSDGTTLAIAGRESTIRLYNVATGEEVQKIDVQKTLDAEMRT